jgi:hypothetical protein
MEVSELSRLTALLATLFVAACSKTSTEVTELSVPDSSLKLTFSAGRGGGPLVADSSELTMSLHKGKESDSEVVLSGIYITLKRVTWDNPHNATICIDGGYTSTFRNNITLNANDQHYSYPVHFALREDC